MNLHQLTPDEFRKKIAGITDVYRSLDEFEKSALEDECVKFIKILPEVFSDDFDRKTLWERIGNGITVSLSKSGFILDQFINCILDYIKAEPGKVASNDSLLMFIQSSQSRPEEWKNQFLKTLEKKYYLILVKARSVWNQNKKEGK